MKLTSGQSWVSQLHNAVAHRRKTSLFFIHGFYCSLQFPFRCSNQMQLTIFWTCLCWVILLSCLIFRRVISWVCISAIITGTYFHCNRESRLNSRIIRIIDIPVLVFIFRHGELRSCNAALKQSGCTDTPDVLILENQWISKRSFFGKYDCKRNFSVARHFQLRPTDSCDYAVLKI